MFSDFAFSTGTVANQVYTAGSSMEQGNTVFTISRNTAFTHGEQVTLSYTPNANAAKVFTDLDGKKAIAQTGITITIEVV